MNYKKLTSILIIVFLIICIISLIILFILFNKKYNESFILKPEPIDRTRLYGSLFLDNLDTQIQNLTNPPIMYDTKRIEIIRYSDLLL
jgi:hypothetical protein